MIFTVEITDPSLLAGIADSRTAYNNSLSVGPDQKREDHPDYKATDNDYVSFVMTKAAESYARQFGFTQDDIAKLEAKLVEMKGKISDNTK